MPLTEKGRDIKRSMNKQYGKEKAEKVFYASRNKGTISGVDAGQQPDYSESGTGAESWVGGRRTGYRINSGDRRSIVDKAVFRRTIGDSLRNGVNISDALARGVVAATNTRDAARARRGTFFRSVRDAALKGGMSAADVIRDALGRIGPFR